MKISELTEELQAIKDKHGDLPVMGSHREGFEDNVRGALHHINRYTNRDGVTICTDAAFIVV